LGGGTLGRETLAEMWESLFVFYPPRQALGKTIAKVVNGFLDTNWQEKKKSKKKARKTNIARYCDEKQQSC